MDLPDGGAEVPFGAILAALKMIEGGSEGGEPTAVSEEVAALLDVWGIPVITQAFGLLIYGAMAAIRPGEDAPDRLHMVVPAVLTRLRAIESARPFLPTMAGVLTAAATDADAWQWRTALGPVTSKETAAWLLTAWLLADFVDNLVYRESGKFVRVGAEIITRASGGHPGEM